MKTGQAKLVMQTLRSIGADSDKKGREDGALGSSSDTNKQDVEFVENFYANQEEENSCARGG